MKRFIRSRSGNAAVEFCIIAPVMIVMFAALVELGRAFQVYNSANRLATQYAMAWSDCSDNPVGTCSAELATYANTNVQTNIAPQLTPSPVMLQIFQVSRTTSSTSVSSSYPSGASLTGPQTTALQTDLPTPPAASSGAPAQVAVLVTVTYSHSLQYFQTLMGGILPANFNVSYTVVQLKS